MILSPPERTLLKNKAYDRLKCLIIEGAYPSGTFLSERYLAETFEMSKAPIRSAIERLSAEGFVRVSPQQGIMVVELSLDEIIDHFELRIALESYIAERLAGRLTAAQLRTLQDNLAAQSASALADDLDTYRRLDTAFHVLVATALGNQEILRVMNRQSEKLYRIITRIIGQQRPRMKESTEEHTAILKSIEAGDGPLAAARMKAHLEWGKRSLITR